MGANQLSMPVQMIIFFVFIGLVLVFIKMNSYERRIQELEKSLTKYVPYEDYMETFQNMFRDMVERAED